MNEHESLGFRLEKRRIDAGFGFGLAAFVGGIGLLLLLDRIGLPDRLLRSLVLALTICIFLVTALVRRTTQSAYFLAAGRALPATYAGLAAAAIAAALFTCLLQLIVKEAYLTSLTLGFGLGLLGAFFAAGLLLRRSASISIADLVATRFPYLSIRFTMATITAACAALIAWAGYDIALRGLMSLTGLGRLGGACVVGATLCFLVVPGGLSTILWIAAETAIVLACGLTLPLAADLIHGTALALPVIGDPALWDLAQTRLASMVGDPTAANQVSAVSFVLALAAGLTALAPLHGPVVASGGERAFARTGLVASGWLVFFAILAAATMAASTLALDKALVGHAPADVAKPLYVANAEGIVTLCGGADATASALTKDCASRRGFAGVLRPGDVRARPDFLLENLAKLRQLGPVFVGLADSFVIGIGLTLAVSGIQSFATSLGDDAISPRRRRMTSASLRLALTRALSVAVIAALGILLSFRAADAGVAVALSVFISTTFIAPVTALLLWPRADSFDASVTFFVSLILIANLIIVHRPFAGPADLSPAVLFAGLGGFAAGLFSCLQRSKTAAVVKSSS